MLVRLPLSTPADRCRSVTGGRTSELLSRGARHRDSGCPRSSHATCRNGRIREAARFRAPYVYLICDRVDLDAALTVRDVLYASDRRIEVTLPVFDGDKASVLHREHLTDCRCRPALRRECFGVLAGSDAARIAQDGRAPAPSPGRRAKPSTLGRPVPRTRIAFKPAKHWSSASSGRRRRPACNRSCRCSRSPGHHERCGSHRSRRFRAFVLRVARGARVLRTRAAER